MGLLTLSAGFWDFEECSKRDILLEGKHSHIISGALSDKDTRIDVVDAGTFILYGGEQALLLRPANPILRLTVMIYMAICRLGESYPLPIG